MTSNPGGTWPHAPGFYPGDRPKIVTSRFEYEDSYTLQRYLATDGYAGLRAALGRPATDIHDEVKNATVTNGILSVELERIIPVEKLPKKIDIKYNK